MKRTKNRRNNPNIEDSTIELAAVKPKKQAKVKPLISFDAYFQALVKQQKALPHHKAPMRTFAKKNDMLNGTKEDFEKLFRSY